MAFEWLFASWKHSRDCRPDMPKVPRESVVKLKQVNWVSFEVLNRISANVRATASFKFIERWTCSCDTPLNLKTKQQEQVRQFWMSSRIFKKHLCFRFLCFVFFPKFSKISDSFLKDETNRCFSWNQTVSWQSDARRRPWSNRNQRSEAYLSALAGKSWTRIFNAQQISALNRAALSDSSWISTWLCFLLDRCNADSKQAVCVCCRFHWLKSSNHSKFTKHVAIIIPSIPQSDWL